MLLHIHVTSYSCYFMSLHVTSFYFIQIHQTLYWYLDSRAYILDPCIQEFLDHNLTHEKISQFQLGPYKLRDGLVSSCVCQGHLNCVSNHKNISWFQLGHIFCSIMYWSHFALILNDNVFVFDARNFNASNCPNCAA